MAKAGIYRVHLKSMLRGGESWGEGTMYVIGTEIANLLLQVCMDDASPFASAAYTWEVDAAKIQPHEQLVYFVERSLIEEFDTSQNITTSGATFKIGTDGVLSEVHVDQIFGDAHFAPKVARLAFHELMH